MPPPAKTSHDVDICCVIENDCDVFKVTMSLGQDVDDLKKEVAQLSFNLSTCVLARNLELWKVSFYIQPVYARVSLIPLW